jgi:hypothetical protein
MTIALLIGISFRFLHASALMPTDSLPPSVRDSVIHVLFDVDDDDQQYRLQLAALREENKADSQVVKGIYKKMKAADSVNLVKVAAIIDKYGWLGPDEIGDQCNTALFMVIQHADLSTQQRYLPTMRAAALKARIKARHLAMLEDRVNVFTGKKQIYGSQVFWDTWRSAYLLAPLEDPDNVDARRSAVGLPPLKVYLSGFGIIWDLEAYKKRLPQDIEYFKTPK